MIIRFSRDLSDAAFPTTNQMIQSNLETVPEITFLRIGLSRPKNEFIFIEHMIRLIHHISFKLNLLQVKVNWNLE